MMGSLLLRGMLVGLVAGLLAFGFARVFGEPHVARAIAFEEEMDRAKAAAEGGKAEEEPELVSRPTQAGVGLATGVVVYGASLGGLVALVFAFVHGRLGRLGARANAALIALAGFVAIVLVPALKYPANPPSVGSPDTIGFRTAAFFALLAASLVALGAAVALARALSARWGTWNAGLAGAAFFVAAVAVAALALPEINEVPDGFPAALLWNFRLASFGLQAVLWGAIGVLFGIAVERPLADRAGR